jgi:hypothetical protein
VVLGLCAVGAVAVVVGFRRQAVDGRFEVDRGPTTVVAAADQQIHLYPHFADDLTTTCVVAPAAGESRELTVPERGREGTRTDVWWSGRATVTCGRSVGGQVHDRNPFAWAMVLLAAAGVVLFAAIRAVRTIRRRTDSP